MDANRLLLVATVLLVSLAVAPLQLPNVAATSHPEADAAFAYTQMFAYGNYYVRFTDATTEIVPVRWEWKFGDGYTGVGQTTAHRYREAGAYNVTLTVWAENGAMAIVEQEIGVEDTMPLYAAFALAAIALGAVVAIWFGSRKKWWWLVVAAAAVLALSGLALLDQVGVGL